MHLHEERLHGGEGILWESLITGVPDTGSDSIDGLSTRDRLVDHRAAPTDQIDGIGGELDRGSVGDTEDILECHRVGGDAHL